MPTIPITRHQFILSAARILLRVPPASPAETEQGLLDKYIDPRYQTAIRFGATSPYLQPWRAFQNTLPVSALRNTIGVNMNLDKENPELVCRHLAACGVQHARIEMGWGNVFEGVDDSAVSVAFRERTRPLLLACKANGLRPLILLNANHGVPCPMTNVQRTLAKPARKGDTVAYLADTSGLRERYSGFNNVSQYKACEVFFTKIGSDGKVVLSKTLPKDLGDAGATVNVGTLRYLPFGFSDEASREETYTGWKSYVRNVARFVAETLTPGASQKRGFDMEIWNELTFGSDFLYADSYYEKDTFPRGRDSTTEIVRITVEVAEANPTIFTGVQLCDGFSNTIPWTASSKEPTSIHAISKHPYTGRKTYNGKPPNGFPVVNARFREEVKPTFYPTYSVAFPEYYANALQTEHNIRDFSPITTDLYGKKHGRLARGTAAKPSPVRVWFTEWGLVPKEWGVSGDEAAQNLKAKAFLRTLCFYVSKGLERLYFYAAKGKDSELGVVSERFIAYAAKEKEFPGDDALYRSPALATLKRLTDALPNTNGFSKTRPLVVEDIRDTHEHFQWRGDGTPEHPTLFNRECFAFLPFQASETQFVLAYYIQTRDITKTLPNEQYTLILSGFTNPKEVFLNRLYDPLTGKNVSGAHILYVDGRGHVALSLPTTDYPYLLFLEDTG